MGINGDILPVDGYGPDVGYADLTTVPLAESAATRMGGRHRRGDRRSASTTASRWRCAHVRR